MKNHFIESYGKVLVVLCKKKIRVKLEYDIPVKLPEKKKNAVYILMKR